MRKTLWLKAHGARGMQGTSRRLNITSPFWPDFGRIRETREEVHSIGLTIRVTATIEFHGSCELVKWVHTQTGCPRSRNGISMKAKYGQIYDSNQRREDNF